MDRYVQIYRTGGAAYHELIAAEDADGNLAAAFHDILQPQGKRILDLGSGTGRIPLLLKDASAQIVALDLHRDMLRAQLEQRARIRRDWPLLQADLRRIPIPTHWADAVVAAWALGHFLSWYVDRWEVEVERALAEMQRAARPGGTLLILETMGTASEKPGPPTPALAEYYAWLGNQGFTRQVLSTDYDFGSVARAARLCGFFFGDALEERIIQKNWSRVPEWTGLWHRKAN